MTGGLRTETQCNEHACAISPSGSLSNKDLTRANTVLPKTKQSECTFRRLVQWSNLERLRHCAGSLDRDQVLAGVVNLVADWRGVLHKSLALFTQRKPHFEASAFARFAHHQDLAIVPRDDAMRSR